MTKIVFFMMVEQQDNNPSVHSEIKKTARLGDFFIPAK